LTGDVFDETIDCVALLEPRWGALARYRTSTTSHSRSHSLQPLLLTPLTSSLLLFLKLALFSQKTNLAPTNCVALLDGPRALALAVRHLVAPPPNSPPLAQHLVGLRPPLMYTNDGCGWASSGQYSKHRTASGLQLLLICGVRSWAVDWRENVASCARVHGGWEGGAAPWTWSGGS
jgi:hypothetical protein